MSMSYLIPYVVLTKRIIVSNIIVTSSWLIAHNDHVKGQECLKMNCPLSGMMLHLSSLHWRLTKRPKISLMDQQLSHQTNSTHKWLRAVMVVVTWHAFIVALSEFPFTNFLDLLWLPPNLSGKCHNFVNSVQAGAVRQLFVWVQVYVSVFCFCIGRFQGWPDRKKVHGKGLQLHKIEFGTFVLKHLVCEPTASIEKKRSLAEYS